MILAHCAPPPPHLGSMVFGLECFLQSVMGTLVRPKVFPSWTLKTLVLLSFKVVEESRVHILEMGKNIKNSKITKRCPSVTYETLVVKSTNAFYIFSTSNYSKKATRTFGLIFWDYHFLAESGTFTKKTILLIIHTKWSKNLLCTKLHCIITQN